MSSNWYIRKVWRQSDILHQFAEKKTRGFKSSTKIKDKKNQYRKLDILWGKKPSYIYSNHHLLVVEIIVHAVCHKQASN